MLALPWKLNWRSAATPACYQKVCFHTKHLQQIYRFISPGVHLLGKISTNVEFIGDTGYAPMEMETGFAVGTDKVRGQGGWKKGNTLALFRVASHTKCFDHICYTKYQLLLLILMTKHIYRKFSKLDANKLGKHLLSTKFVAPKLNISGSVKYPLLAYLARRMASVKGLVGPCSTGNQQQIQPQPIYPYLPHTQVQALYKYYTHVQLTCSMHHRKFE